jgi:hypothetical protein
MNENVAKDRPDHELFRAVFSEIENAASLLQYILPPSLTEKLAWGTLRREPDYFLGDEKPEAIGAAILFSVASRRDPNDRLYLLLDYADEEKGDSTESALIIARQERIEDLLLAERAVEYRPRVLSVIVRRGPSGEPASKSERAADDAGDP